MIARVRLPRRDDQIAIDAALSDPNLLGAALGSPKSWATWMTTLRAAYGLPLSEQTRQTFASISGNRVPPTDRARELWCVIGRGGGKSRMAAAIAVHTALLQHHKLAPGETGHVLVLSQTVGQARIVFGYCLAFIEQSPITQNEIRLRNNVIIGTHPNSYRSVRGRTLIACIFDESAFWRDESSALPDVETYRAVLPSLIRTGGQLIGISTPYRKLGLLFQKHKDHFKHLDTKTQNLLARALDEVREGVAATQRAVIERCQMRVAPWMNVRFRG